MTTLTTKITDVLKFLYFLCASNSRLTRMNGLVRSCLHSDLYGGWGSQELAGPVTLCCGSQGFSMRSSTWLPYVGPGVFSFLTLKPRGYMESALCGSCNGLSLTDLRVKEARFCCFLSAMMSHNPHSASSPPFTQRHVQKVERRVMKESHCRRICRTREVATICVK